MIKRNINKTTIITTILILLGSYYVYSFMTREIPFTPPTTVIKYNGKAVPTSFGDSNWVAKSGGSSNETEGEFTVGQKNSKFTAKPNDKVYIFIPSKPKSMEIIQLLSINKGKEYKSYIGANEYALTLPSEKGEYIFEVFAKWDADNHNTATIFRVEVK